MNASYILPDSIVSLAGLAEPYAGLSHLLGAFVFTALAIITLRRRHHALPRAHSVLVFVTSCIVLLAISGIYHLLAPETAARAWMRRVDHAAIFVLIAGTYTPVAAFLMEEDRGRRLLVWVWGAAIAGVVAKLVWFESISYSAGVGMYLGLSWMALVVGAEICRRHGYATLRPLLVGGLVYTFGALAEILWDPTVIPGVFGSHELFHTSVLVGAGFHWYFVFGLLLRSDQALMGRVDRDRAGSEGCVGSIAQALGDESALVPLNIEPTL
ncbi:MAG: channel protein (hemolysin III family) [Hyphomicrobiaceae bacterium]